MRSMISSSERALLRSDFRRFWPLLFGYAMLWLCALPLALWSRRDYLGPRQPLQAMNVINNYLNGSITGVIIISACFAVLLAMALFAYLMNSRSVGLLHALPLSRGRQFTVHFAAGVVMFTVVHVAAALLSLPVQTALGAVDFRGTMEWLAVAELSGLIFFSLATLCAMVTGWLLAIPVIFVGVNFMFAAFYFLFVGVSQIFYWGYQSSGWPAWVEWLTPIVRMVRTVGMSDPVLCGEEDGARWYVSYLSAESWKTLAVYTVAAILLVAAAYLFYRLRHSETAGDAIVFPWLRPVVLYVISLAGGLGLGLLLWAMIRNERSFFGLLICQVAAGLILYFGVRMLLHKSFKVFGRRGWIGAAALALVLVLVTASVKVDLFGTEKFVPDPQRVSSVTITSYGSVPSVYGLEDPQGIEAATAFHKAILAQGEPAEGEINAVIGVPTSEYTGQENYFSFYIDYKMKDGSYARRSYSQIIRRGTPLYEAANAFYNEPSVKAASRDSRYDFPTIDPATISGGWFNNYNQDGGGSTELTAAQARRLCTVLQSYFQKESRQPVDVLAQQADEQNYASVYLEFIYRDANTNTTEAVSGSTARDDTGDSVWSIDSLPSDCTEVLDLLVSFGLVKDVNELLNQK